MKHPKTTGTASILTDLDAVVKVGGPWSIVVNYREQSPRRRDNDHKRHSCSVCSTEIEPTLQNPQDKKIKNDTFQMELHCKII